MYNNEESSTVETPFENLKVTAIIPARYASERFPGKVIKPLLGKPLVMHTYESTLCAQSVSDVIIATDDKRVMDAISSFNPKVVMTNPKHSTGTERIAEVANNLEVDIIVNVQGDEPLIDPDLIDSVVQALVNNPKASMATARLAIHDKKLIDDKNCVKVVCDLHGRALYFSRFPIPCIRSMDSELEERTTHWQHIGIYAYRREFLLKFATLPATLLEKCEKLEQLRAMENGFIITVIDASKASIGVDTPEDLERARIALSSIKL